MKTKLLLLLTSVSFLTFPETNSAQAPNLASAAPFALFTAVGAFDNVGFTTITGDIGTNSGAFNGFPPGTVSGQIHVANPVSTQAAMDVEAAYNELTPAICGFLLAPGLGNNQVITPGISCTGGASDLNGTLILDGQGDPNAIFIIKIGGALITGSFSDISLINSANLKNVYWQVNGRVDLGENSFFKGTLLVNGAINLMLNASLEGRGLSRAGAITLDNNNVSNSLATLPVTLINFSAQRQASHILLKWSTASEQNSRSFTVERSNSSIANSWIPVGSLTAAGISTSTRLYSLIDNNVNIGANYYRLRSTDLDGHYSISNVKAVWFDESQAVQVKIFPNPVSQNLVITGVKQGSIIFLLDMAGKSLLEQQATGNGTDQLEISRLESAIYLLKIISTEGNTITIKFIKQ